MSNSSNHTKIVNSKISSVDEYGFERGNDFNYEAYEEFLSEYLAVLTNRGRKWAKLLKNKESVGKSRMLKRYVRKGIPLKHRGKVWMSVSGAEARLRSHPVLYEKLLKQPRKPELWEIIKVDLPRTFPDNIHFKAVDSQKIQSLSNILHAFGHQCPSVGYCQGLNYIAALLLLVVGSEESAFWLLTVLVEDILPSYHTPDMTGVLTDIEALGSIVKEKNPIVWQHLVYNKVDLTLVTTKWFICLFVEVLPIETVLRIWDCLFYEGNKIIMRVALSLILNNASELLMSHDFTSIIESFKKMATNASALDCHTFMKTVFESTNPLPRSLLKLFRDESTEIVIKRKEEFEGKKNDPGRKLT